jgi:ATP-dependent DNA ligase
VGKPDLLFVDTPEITIPGIVKLIAKTKAEGREGVVITDLEAPEYKNVRVKIKHKNTMNLRVVRILQEVDIRGNPKPSAGALELADATGRIVGKVGTGFTKQDREDIWNNQEEWLTKVVQVTFRNIVREGGMLIQPAYNGLSDGEVDSIREFNK